MDLVIWYNLYPSKSRFTETGWLGSYPHVWNEKIMGLLVCNWEKNCNKYKCQPVPFANLLSKFPSNMGTFEDVYISPWFWVFLFFPLFCDYQTTETPINFHFPRKGLIIDSSRLGYHQTDLRLGIVVHAKGTFGIWEQKWKWDGNVGELWTHKNKESKS